MSPQRLQAPDGCFRTTLSLAIVNVVSFEDPAYLGYDQTS